VPQVHEIEILDLGMNIESVIVNTFIFLEICLS
jgi:hypothetical protein